MFYLNLLQSLNLPAILKITFMAPQWISFIGYAASLCLIIALLVNHDLKFRWFTALGNIFFICYALFLFAIPVLITNSILLSINIYYLLKIYRKKESFDLAEFSSEEKLPKKYLQFYKEDIADYFPAFREQQLNNNLNFVVTRDLAVANIFSARVSPNGDALVDLNYTIQKFRDYKVGSYIFEKEKDFLHSKGVKRIVYDTTPQKTHLDFLRINGFTQATVDGKTYWIKDI
jgi:hypothetical protein